MYMHKNISVLSGKRVEGSIIQQFFKTLSKEVWCRDMLKKYKIPLQKAILGSQTDIKAWENPVVSFFMYCVY